MLRYRLMIAFIFGIFFLLIDWYFYQAVKVVSENWTPGGRQIFRIAFWIPSILSLAAMLWWTFDDPFRHSAQVRNWIITALMATYFSKLLGVVVLLIGDLGRMVQYIISAWKPSSVPPPTGEVALMPRSEFLGKAALIGAGLPMGAFVFGIVSGAHDYRLRKQKILVKNLPKSLHGLTVGQLSDIHSGSFWNKTAVKGGVELMMSQRPELIMFTGDLVNNETSEYRGYSEIFSKLSAPLGVYSVTGNHDYGDYRSWTSKSEKKKNFDDLVTAHRETGFDLLLNQNRKIKIGDSELFVAGVENWGAGRFAKYGKLEEAMIGQDQADFRILLSHDPSHWDAEVRKKFSGIELMLSGHTHGFQFGVEYGGFKWSPSQYLYKQWAGLYQEGKQNLYVNRGFGYLGYPGRVGIPPEVTVLELVRA